MITEFVTEDCWNFSFPVTGINYILKYIQIEKRYLKTVLILQDYDTFMIFQKHLLF